MTVMYVHTFSPVVFPVPRIFQIGVVHAQQQGERSVLTNQGFLWQALSMKH